MQSRNILAGPYLDRAAHLRKDAQWFANALADGRSRALPVWNSRNLIVAGEAPRDPVEVVADGLPEERDGARPVSVGRKRHAECHGIAAPNPCRR